MIRHMRPGSYQGRLLAAFSGLLTVAVIIAGVAVSITTSRTVTVQMHENVTVGARVLSSHIVQRRDQLAASVRVLSNDFGFKSAVATRDTATIATALANHGNRISADLVVLLDEHGQPIRASREDIDELAPGFARSLKQARADGEAAGVRALDGALYQYFVVPVMAPNPIAWVVMGFVLDQQIADYLGTLTGLDVSFIATDGSGAPLATVSTLPAEQRPMLDDIRGPTQSGYGEVTASRDGDYLMLAYSLAMDGSDPVLAVVQLATRTIAETRLLLIQQLALVLATALGVMLLISLVLARRMSNPVRQLIRAAREIEQGRYSSPVELDGGGEMSLLANAINTMQAGIREREQRIRHQAHHDSLTGLHNKAWLDARYPDLRAHPPFALALFELADLKDISFSLGYRISDALIVAAAERLREESDLIDLARVSGSGFAAMLDVGSAGVALARTRALQRALSGPFRVDGRPVASQVVAAVINFPDDADDFAVLYRNVETTLEAARNRPDQCLGYLPGQAEARTRQLQIINSFEDAFADRQLQLHFQPKVSLPLQNVVECEALLRWVHPTLGFVPPDEFILLAERSGNIRRLTDWVIDAALAQGASWNRDGLPMRVAINLSAHDLADPGLPQMIRDSMTRHGASGSMFTLEITESAVLRDRDRAAETLIRLKRLGIRLSIDDFGTGHSSLAQLKKLPVDELKIDKSFVLELDRNPDDAMIVRSTIELGHNLGLEVVAEGVENATVLQQLLEFHCDKVQGYYFSRPLAAEPFAEWALDFNAQRRAGMRQTG